MNEFTLRVVAILVTAVMLIGFGWYFAFGTDTLQHDYIFFGGGVASLLSGFATLGLLPLVLKMRKEYGDEGMLSDVGYPEMAGPPPNRGGAAARAATAASSDDSDSDSAE